ncbi:hypothetical protein ZWY2020_003970 [Hordeum vulgare]|nr:hypothetical protein ZWY2020_003970 [Hordeum vulgare]
MLPTEGTATAASPDKKDWWMNPCFGCLFLLLYLTTMFTLCWCVLAILGEEYYTVEITGIRSSNFHQAQDAAALPSFDITMRIHNHYKKDLYFQDWQFAISLDGIPLGHGSFPYDLMAYNMSDATVTGTTSTVMTGLAKEVHDHISSGTSFGDLELQVDMRSIVSVGGSTDRTWLWCSSGLGDHSPPSPCQHIPVREA